MRGALNIWRGRIVDAPESQGYRNNLAWTLGELEHAAHRTGNYSEWLLEALPGAFDTAVKAHPDVAEYRNQQAKALAWVANALRALGRAAAEARCYEQAIAIHEELIKTSPTATAYRGDLAYSLRRLGSVRLAAGDTSGAIADARRAVDLYEGLRPQSGDEWYELACCHATLAAAGRPTWGDSAFETEAAMVLAKAAGMGNRNPDVYRTESALDPANRPASDGDPENQARGARKATVHKSKPYSDLRLG